MTTRRAGETRGRRSFARGAALAAAVTALLALGCGQGRDRWVAEVDGESITLAELEGAVAPRRESEPHVSGEDLIHEELERLVTEQIVLNRATELGVEISPEEVSRRIRQMVGGDEAAAAEVASRGYEDQLRRQMTMDRTAVLELAGQIELSESAILHYFEEHRERYAEPRRVQIRQILVAEEEKAHKLLAEIRKGADFEELARQHSIAPEAEEGGLIPPFASGELPEVFDRAFKLGKGQVSPVIGSPFGFHIFRQEATLEAHEPTLEEVREQVRLDLERERLSELRRAWLRELRVAADIRVNDRLLETLQ